MSHTEQKPPPTFADESEIFLKTAGGGQSKNTFLTYRSGLAYFRAYLAETYDWPDNRPIAELTPEQIQQLPAWLLEQTYRRSEQDPPTPLAESTRALYLLAVSRFLRFLVLRRRLPHFDYAEYHRVKEELAQATAPKADPIEQKIPPTEIVEALVAAARQPVEIKADAPPATRRRQTLIWRRNLAIILALRSSGMRVGELVKLRRADLDYARQGAWVRGKGRQTRFVAFDDEAWQAIQTYLNERLDTLLPRQMAPLPVFCRHDHRVKAEERLPLSVRAVQYSVKQLAEQANVAEKFNLSPHSLRHYFADGLLEFTRNLALVQDALGHQDPRTTRVYTKIKVEEIATQVRAMARHSEEEPAGESEAE